jgi:pyruvate kinase
MADLQGPKIRVGKFEKARSCWPTATPSSSIRLPDGQPGTRGPGLQGLPRDVKAGDVLLLNDGLIVLTVDRVRGNGCTPSSSSAASCPTTRASTARGGLTAPALTAKDMDDIKTAMSFQADYVAVSFPKNATDMEMARQLCNVAGEPLRPQADDRQDRARRGHSALGKSSMPPTASWWPVATWP